MSNAAHILPPGVRAAAESILALASASWFARLAPGQALDDMPANAFEHLVAAARALLGAVENAEDAALVGPAPRLLCETYVDTVRLDLSLAALLLLGRDRAGRDCGALTAVGGGTQLFGHDLARALWDASSAAAGVPLSPAKPAAQEPTP